MVTEEYANACAEVVRILDYIPYKDYKKIPKDIILYYEKNANKNCDFEYNVKISLDEQNVSKTAKTIIAILFRDYWATSDQKDKILNYEKHKITAEEEIKKEKYNNKNIFNKNEENLIENMKVKKKDNIDIIPLENKGYKKILNQILKFLRLRK